MLVKNLLQNIFKKFSVIKGGLFSTSKIKFVKDLSYRSMKLNFTKKES
jgi:hypothetical protein